MKRSIIVLSLFLLFFSCQKTAEQKPPNILFIAVDDLRPELACYGNEVVKSPHLDQLASEGILFTKHYTQVPTCGASRYALLTGMRPKGKPFLNNNAIERFISKQEEAEKPESFIHQLKRNGYHTVGIGKISHSADGYVYGYEDQVSTQRELPHSWSELHFNAGKWQTGWNAFFAYANGENRQSLKKQVKPYEKGEGDDTIYPDGLSSRLAIEKLKELKQKGQPFFLGLGFFKPHLPFNSPAKYWDLYDRDDIQTSPNPLVPEKVNLASLHENGEFNQYQLGEEQATLDMPVSESYARKLKHAYYASVSYTDQQIGLVLEELKRLELDKNTIVVVWGDHGWHLGDQQIWGKHTLFENALRSALIIKAPGGKKQASVVSSVVETVDLYPTLLELAEVELPHPVDGKSLVKQIKDPSVGVEKELAFGYFRNGVTMRTAQYRITKYNRQEQPYIELYDHTIDPLEARNIASEKPGVVEKLLPELQAAFDDFFQQ